TQSADAVRSAARGALADPFALAAPGVPRLTVPPVPPDAHLRALPAGVVQSITTLERAALSAQQIASGAFLKLTPHERATLVAHAAQMMHDGTDAGNRLHTAV